MLQHGMKHYELLVLNDYLNPNYFADFCLLFGCWLAVAVAGVSRARPCPMSHGPLPMSHGPLPHAPWPHCPIAPWPHCPMAPLPHGPIAPMPHGPMPHAPWLMPALKIRTALEVWVSHSVCKINYGNYSLLT
jgi:hypothetical protein